MTYPETLAYIFERLPMFQRIGKSAYRDNLTTALLLDDYFEHPHQRYPTIHVAGTNGKGSVSHMLAAILQVAGYKTGLFTSPHLKNFRERIRVNGQMIPEEAIVAFIEQSQEIFKQTKPSFFEMTSALAFYYFSAVKVDIAVIEVGMGGRLDSTNIIYPQLSVITNIGLDHTEFLGDTIEKITGEKAGIIKYKVPIVIGEYHEQTWPVFVNKAVALQTYPLLADRLYRTERSSRNSQDSQLLNIIREGNLLYKDLSLDLVGFYQQKNICTVLMAVDVLLQAGYHISPQQLYEAVANVQKLTGLQGRWQQIGTSPLIICDTGHNVDGFRLVLKQIQSVPYHQLHMVIGFVNDKDIGGILRMFPNDALYYFTNANIPRALQSEDLKMQAISAGLHGESYPSVTEAVEAAKNHAAPEDMIYIGGSTFVVAEAI